jgi:hypothetical protein
MAFNAVNRQTQSGFGTKSSIRLSVEAIYNSFDDLYRFVCPLASWLR